MKLVKQDIGVWIKCSDELPDTEGLYVIVHNAPGGYGKHEMYFKTDDEKWYWQPNPYSVCGHGFITDWLKSIKEVYVLTEEEYKLLNNNSEAVEIVRELAEWSKRYPRGVMHSYSAKIDEQLIALEEKAKSFFLPSPPIQQPKI